MTMYRVRVGHTGFQGGPYLSTHFFDVVGGTAQQAANAAGTFWTGVQGQQDSDGDWATEAEVALVNEATGSIVDVNTTTPVVGGGTVAGEVLPFASQGLVRWSTAIISEGRRIKGRTFIPGLTEAAVTSGLVTAAVQTALTVAADAMIDDLNSIAVVWQRPRVAVPTADPPITARVGSMAAISGASVWNNLAVLRSRRD